MRSSRIVGRPLTAWVVAALMLTCLLVAAVLASPAPQDADAPKPAAPPKKSSSAAAPNRFPLSLFAKADEGDYSGGKNCTNCHRTATDSYERSPHAIFMKNPHNSADKSGCEGCHGPSKPHVAHRKEEEGLYNNVISYTHSTPEQIASACLRCHNDTLTESHWKRTEHAHANVSCTSCHQIHWADRAGQERIPTTTDSHPDDLTRSVAAAPRDAGIFTHSAAKALLKSDELKLCGTCHRKVAASMRQNFHHPVPEGKLVCSDCHSPHPNNDVRKTVQTTKQSCIVCHADVAGPFAFEHDPASNLTGDGCLECHNPHGSPNPAMLTSFSRGLCIKCHSDKAATHNPGRTCWDSGCHSAIHGSNHSGIFLQR